MTHQMVSTVTTQGRLSSPPTASTRAARRPQPHLAARQAVAPAVHLTRRGQLAMVLALAALLLAAFSLRQAHSDAATTPEPAAGQSRVQSQVTQPAQQPQRVQMTVHQGDTLWSVARRLAPERDAREVVAELRLLNVLPGGTLRVGQQLLLPAPA